MIGLLIIGAAVLAMYRVADTEGKSGLLWGFITFLICLACGVLIPLPLVNVGIGFGVSFLAFFAYKVIANE